MHGGWPECIIPTVSIYVRCTSRRSQPHPNRNTTTNTTSTTPPPGVVYSQAQYYYDEQNSNDHDTNNDTDHDDNDGATIHNNSDDNNTNNSQRKRKQNKKKLTTFGRILQEEARKIFMRYDLIIVLKWLHQDPAYARRIEDVHFQGSRFLFNQASKQQQPYCGEKSKRANALVPLTVSKATKRVLQQRNAIDTTLYNLFTTC